MVSSAAASTAPLARPSNQDRNKTATRSNTKKKVPKAVQDAVDEWVQLHAQYKKIERQLGALRDIIEPYMEDNDVQVLSGSAGGGIGRISMDRPPVTARYTSYDIDDVEEFLSEEAKEKCLVKVVDRDMLEACCKLGIAPEEILTELKITTRSYQLRSK